MLGGEQTLQMIEAFLQSCPETSFKYYIWVSLGELSKDANICRVSYIGMSSFDLHEGLVGDHPNHPLGLHLDYLADLEVAAQLVGPGKGHPTLTAAVRLLRTRAGGMFGGKVSFHPFTLIPSNLELTSLHSTLVHCPPSGSLLDYSNIPKITDR